MRYGKIEYGTLHRKVNRFIAEVFIDGELEKVHIKNTGRLKELLVPGARVVLEISTNPKRKTRYSIIAVWKNGKLVNIDSQAPNVVAFDAMKNGNLREVGEVAVVKREVTFGDSRFDLYYEQNDVQGFVEVKGVTLERNGVAMFPDAPTTRGTKHVQELANAIKRGYKAAILFVVQMKGCHRFVPYTEMDQDFAKALQEVSELGVQVIAYDTVVTEDTLLLDEPIPVDLSEIDV
ncbi:DNA/RNA nuclease SfsA [Oceanobacillus halotolerans]|uniref:DNA/RNA nuclease SfsA n=1 Tax=Oceanobacillus halotolerans TaxID=2663380 RepID=UPI0013DCE5DD|nr:DNA/RNA nuclease SfsA [Oceanobacillus halotolerans]